MKNRISDLWEKVKMKDRVSDLWEKAKNFGVNKESKSIEEHINNLREWAKVIWEISVLMRDLLEKYKRKHT